MFNVLSCRCITCDLPASTEEQPNTSNATLMGNKVMKKQLAPTELEHFLLVSGVNPSRLSLSVTLRQYLLSRSLAVLKRETLRIGMGH